MLRRRVVLSILTALAVWTVPLLGATPAVARWSYHNDADVTQITTPPGGTDDQTCQDRLRGETGWSAYLDETQDPSQYQVPDNALLPASYTVWKAPPGFTSFGLAEAQFNDVGGVTGYNFPDENGVATIPATQVMTFDTGPRTLLPAPIATDPPEDGANYVFATAPINVALPSSVDPGDVLGVLPSGGFEPVSVTVVDCSFALSGTTFTTAKKATFTGTVATFTGPAGATDYSALIDWGDGRTSVGTVSLGPSGFVVTGTHRYARKGTYPVSVTVTQTATGNDAQAVSTATVRSKHR